MLFDNLAETLLKGGVAPRHVRRYLVELREHLEDLTDQQRQTGYDQEDAALRARALLGSDERYRVRCELNRRNSSTDASISDLRMETLSTLIPIGKRFSRA